MFANNDVCFYHASERSTIALCDITKARGAPLEPWCQKPTENLKFFWQEAVNTWLNPHPKFLILYSSPLEVRMEIKINKRSF